MNANLSMTASKTTKVLITGWSGSGKSTVCKELTQRNYDALDADTIPGLANWVDKHTGLSLGKNFPEDYSSEKYDWNWNSEILTQTLGVKGLQFICGNANNSFAYYPFFDRIFLLHLEPQEQRRRMMLRTEHDYGKDITTQDTVIRTQKTLSTVAIERGAIAIDAMPPAATIVDTILERLK